MPRSSRIAPVGLMFHMFNRDVDRMLRFEASGDYGTYEHCLQRAQNVVPMRRWSYCVMPDHWHLVLWSGDDALAAMAGASARHTFI